jgi:hypothetical protein
MAKKKRPANQASEAGGEPGLRAESETGGSESERVTRIRSAVIDRLKSWVSVADWDDLQPQLPPLLDRASWVVKQVASSGIPETELIDFMAREVLRMAMNPVSSEDDPIAVDKSAQGGEASDHGFWELDDWERFTVEHFPSDFFDVAQALERLPEDLPGEELRRRVEQLVEQYPKSPTGWLRLAQLQSSPAVAAESLRRALSAAQWLLDLAAAYPEYVETLEQAYVIGGLDIAGEFWMMGLRADALEVHQALLTSVPRDRAGQRLLYAFRLLEQGWLDELDEQLACLREEASSVAAVLLLKALYAFILDKQDPAARMALRASVEQNPLTLEVLFSNQQVAWELRDDLTFEEEEALWLGRMAMPTISATEGMARWVRDTLGYTPPDEEAISDAWEERLDSLLELPPSTARWFLETRVIDDLYLTLVVDLEEMVVLSAEDTQQAPTVEAMWEMVVSLIESPDDQLPTRPSCLYVANPSLKKTLAPWCRKLGFACRLTRSIELPDELFEQVAVEISLMEQSLVVDAEILTKAARLPRSQEAWLFGVFQPPVWLYESSTPQRIWVVLAVEVETGLVRLQSTTDTQPDEDFLVSSLLKGFFHPIETDDQPCLPAVLLLDAACPDHSIRSLAERLEIPVGMAEDRELFDEILQGLVIYSSSPSTRQSLFESSDISREALRSLYQLLARFYRAALWRSVPSSRRLEISDTFSEASPCYASLVGQMGIERGMFITTQPPEEFPAGDVAGAIDEEAFTIVSFSEAHEIAPIDLWYIEQEGWEIAGENAFPLLQQALGSKSYRRPNDEELRQVEWAARSLLAMAERPIDDVAHRLTISTSDGSRELILRWI